MYELNHEPFKQLTTAQENKRFDEEWKKICEEKGAHFYPYHTQSTRFFILEKGEVVGTVEFTKRAPATFSICEDYFNFSTHTSVSKNHAEVYEVGKIAILKEHRCGGHVDKIIQLLCLFAQQHQVKQYIAYMNLELYRLLVLVYGLRMERLGEEIKQISHTGVPVLCDVEKTMVQLKKKNKIDLSMLKELNSI